MAKIEISLPNDFLLKLSKLGDRTDEIIPKVLESGGGVVLEKFRSNLSSVVGSGENSRSTGELVNALGLSPAKQDREGEWNIKVGFAEPRSGGGSNAKIANIIEYGRHGQPAKPFLKPAKTQSKSACIEAMKARFDGELQKL